MKRQKGIKSTLLLVFVPLMILIVVCTSALSYYAAKGPLQESAKANLKSIVDEFHAFVEANEDMDWAVIEKLCNEQLVVGKTGFLFVMSTDGSLLIHKKAQGENWADKPHIKEMLSQKNGSIRYLSPLTNTYKLAEFRHLEEWGWIAVAAAFEEDFLGEPRSVIMKQNAISGVIIAVIGAFLTLATARRIVKPINRIITSMNEGADQVNASAAQVGTASQQLAEGANTQASSIEETSSALEQMAAMTRNNADNAQKANELAAQARTNADEGNKTMGQLNNAMTAINESSGEINKIIKVIEEIAFQTNLLALNAAVEAARAGEHGKGFAVVAEEVRNLAQRSAKAAGDTTDLIEGSVNRAKEGTNVANTAAKALQAIVADVAQVADLLNGITQASQEQAQGVEQVNTAVSQMEKVTQQNAAGAEESASAAEELNGQAQVLKNTVEELVTVIVGSKGHYRFAGDTSTAQVTQQTADNTQPDIPVV